MTIIDLNVLQRLFPDITPSQREALTHYARMLRDWNQRINLVSRRDIEHLWAHHLLPSLVPLTLSPPPEGAWLLDIGSGGGLPAIPVAIMRPDLEVLMVDSIRKKALFLETAVAELGLGTVAVVNERVEELGREREYRGRFHVVSARAVASVSTLLDWGAPFLKSGGYWWLWKGSSDVPDLERATEPGGWRCAVDEPPAELARDDERMAAQRWFRVYKP